MESLINDALSSSIIGLHMDLFIGFHFHPTYEEGIRIVDIKNVGGELLPIFKVDDDLFRRPSEQLEECYCFTKLKPAGKNKVNRKLRDGSDRCFWKNINRPEEVIVNNKVIGCVTKLKLYEDKNKPTEWHILEYRDRKTPDAGRWVLCKIYKREKNNDSGSSRGDMNQVRHFEMGECPNTQPERVSNGATYSHVKGEHINQDQPHQSWFPPTDGMVYSPQQFTSNNTYSIGGIDPISGFDPDGWNRYRNADLDTGDFDMD